MRLRHTPHRVAICNGDRCPRCGGSRIGRWGGFAGRRRFRCRGCGRTFSTFTGTPLRYLKAIDRWPRFLRSIDARDTVRRSAARIGVDPTTAFRWRHRFLADGRLCDETVLSGRLRLELTWLAYNEKGRRSTSRAPRRHAYRYPSRVTMEDRVVIALLWHSDTATQALHSPPGAFMPTWMSNALPPHLVGADELVTNITLNAAGAFPPHLRLARPVCNGVDPHATPRLAIRLHRWLRPFRGVATRYLGNYLQWFRSEVARKRDGMRAGGKGSRRRSQQFPPTEPEWPLADGGIRAGRSRSRRSPPP